MTIKEALKKYHKIEIELLLAHVLKKPKEFFYMNPEIGLTRIQKNRLTQITDRRMSGEPMAYILGYKDFMGLRFKVNCNVLIPRPETEQLVESIKLKVKSFRQRKIMILDVGTGSGSIIISLAKKLGLSCKFYASDISPAALKVAGQNAKKHKVKVKFVKSDLLKDVKGIFDIIIANLPYVPENDYKKVAKDLKFEPKFAIFQKENGLYLIRRLLEQIAAMTIHPKLIYFEFDPRQKQKLSTLIKKSLPGSETKFYKDLNNFWRYAGITL